MEPRRPSSLAPSKHGSRRVTSALSSASESGLSETGLGERRRRVLVVGREMSARQYGRRTSSAWRLPCAKSDGGTTFGAVREPS